MTRNFWMWVLAIVVALVVPFFAFTADADKTADELRQAFKKENYKDAYDRLSKLVISPAGTDKLNEDYGLCTQSLQNLGRVDEIDDFREKAIAAHAGDYCFENPVTRLGPPEPV